MKKIIALFSFLAISAFIFINLNGGILPLAEAVGVRVPVIDQVVSGSQPYVSGTTLTGSDVLVYIDGIFAGAASKTSSADGIDGFYYRISSKLNSGVHRLTLVSRDKVSMLTSDWSEPKEFVIPDLQAPRLIQPNEKTLTSNPKVMIEGTTLSGTWVNIFIDGVYNGKTSVLYDKSGTAKIQYRPFVDLSLGWHNAYAIAEDVADGKSLVSNTITFNIEKPMPTPIIRSAYVDASGKLVVSGITKSGSKVRVYVDGRSIGSIQAGSHPSGTAGFTFVSLKTISAGSHKVFIAALDYRGKESPWSGSVNITSGYRYVAPAKVAKPAISQQGASEKKETIAKIETKDESKTIDTDGDGISDFDEVSKYGTDPKKADTDGDGYSDKTEIDHGYSPLIAATTASTTSQPARQDEKNTAAPDIANEPLENNLQPDGTFFKTKESGNATTATSEAATAEDAASTTLFASNKFIINLVIFIAFLLGIIAWILWVNKELIKEKANMTAEEEAKDVKDDNDKMVL